MSKLKYEVVFPKSKTQLEGRFLELFRSKPKNVIIKIIDDYIDHGALIEILNKYRQKIENYKKNKSIIILTDNYEDIPEFIPVAPTETEAMDIIDFENIERDLLLDE